MKCKDCKYCYCFSAVDRLFFCQKGEKEGSINPIEEDIGCEKGEKK